MTKEALRLARQLKDSTSAYWTEQEIDVIEQLIQVLEQTEPPSIATYTCDVCGVSMRMEQPDINNDDILNGAIKNLEKGESALHKARAAIKDLLNLKNVVICDTTDDCVAITGKKRHMDDC